MSVSGSQKASLRCPSFGFDGILSPLQSTMGVVFPYSPTIQMSHSASYGSYDTTHSVYQQQYFINTPNPQINVTATFTANTLKEAEYSMAALHFFKSATKPHFGLTDDNPGVPPAVMRFSCYGSVNARNTPVVVRSVTYTLPEDTDYVQATLPGVGTQSVPSLFIINIDLAVQQTPTRVRNEFNLKDFKSGGILGRGFI